jgi:DMSO/TMAO reductase YedYZ heme-binding membrane subunit
VAYGLVTAAVGLGLVLSLRWQSRTWPRIVSHETHQYLIVLAGVFTLIHGVAVWTDPFTRFSWAEVLIPGMSHYRPVWMAFGIVAAYLGLAVALSVFIRPRIGYAWWHRLHGLAYVVFVLATAHGLGDGSDTRTTWGLLIYAVAGLLVGGLTIVRLLRPVGQRGRSHPGWAALVAGSLAAGVMLTDSGPLQPGWNRIANDGHGSGARIPLALAVGRPTAAGFVAPGYSAPFTGSLVVGGGEGDDGAEGSLTITGRTAGHPPVALTLSLAVAEASEGAMALRGGVGALVVPGSGQVPVQVVGAQGNAIVIAWTNPGGLTQQGMLTLAVTGSTVQGTFTVLGR